MLIFLLCCLSIVLLSNSFLKQRHGSKIQAFLCIFFKRFIKFVLILVQRRRSSECSLRVSKSSPIVGFDGEISLLGLPDLVLDSILEKLSPSELCVLSLVSRSLREKCRSDYLWEKHFEVKWGGVFGDAAQKQWLKHISSRRAAPSLLHSKGERSKSQFSFFGWKLKKRSEERSSSSSNSVISLYSALETGNFWFPAQVFDREVQNGYAGFSLSCYDALLSYDSTTDCFIARYPNKGRSMIEDNIKWYRIRAPPVDTPSSDLHVSDCLEDLRPDDHIEIQWRRNNQFHYGWWYGTVGHLEACSGNAFTCHCHMSDTLVLEFKQYTEGSRWRRAEISRKEHREDVDGFYGGIRRVCKGEEIAKWLSFWPKCTLLS